LRTSKTIVGIDVGGANLKLGAWLEPAAPISVAEVFPLWKHPDRLGEAAASLLERLVPRDPRGGGRLLDGLAVTMTGELADCFATRREGVERIVEQLASVVPRQRISVYAVGGTWRTVDEAIANPWQVAASNWHALANWLGRWQPTADYCRRAVLVDIGSTTVDVLPLENGQCATRARTDRDRLQKGQLVYTGVARTPVCAIVPTLNVRGQPIPVMGEFFATADDAYLALGLAAEDLQDTATADGRPRTAHCARGRLARMVGEDTETLAAAEINQLADQIIAAQARRVADALEANLAALAEVDSLSPCNEPRLIFTGHGWELFERARALLPRTYEVFALPAVLSLQASRSAPALAVAWLRAAD
jgi:probable H4MPT-linked C1 transfer pathway protein